VLSAEPTNHYFGVPLIRAIDVDSYKDALSVAFDLNGPVVIEAVVDGSEYNELLLKPNKI